MSTEDFSLKVFMFPWLGHGHISPFLELAKKLSRRGFKFYFCSTPIVLGSIKEKIIPHEYSLSIHFRELHLPDLPHLPPQYHTTNGLPPHLMSTLQRALKSTKPALLKILENLSPDLLIHDILLQWAAGVASSHNIPAIPFSTSSAAVCTYFCHLMSKPGLEYPFPALHLSDVEHARFCGLVETMKIDFEEKDPDEEMAPPVIVKSVIINSSREIESKYMDYFTQLMPWKVIPLGPVVKDLSFSDEEGAGLIEWLGRKTKYSSVFISFGSEYFLTKEELEEVAYGLELSNVNFIWVVRFPKGEKIIADEAIPEGFLQRVGDRGLIVEGWAPQAKILCHSSIGGFVSHCGWNSILEGIEFGVPIIAMPMHVDQPLNAKLAVEIGIAREIMRNKDGKFQRTEIAQVITDVVTGKVGQNLRNKVRELSENIRLRREEDTDEAARELLTLCRPSKNSCSF